MGKHGWVDQRFMVYEFIRLAGLNLAIEDETRTEAAGLDDIYRLKLGSP
jgi:hypothetical protein